MDFFTPLGATILTDLHVNICPLSFFPTLYVKLDITVYILVSVLWLDRRVASCVTSFCPIVHCNVALGRLPVVVQVTSSGFVSAMLPTFPVMVGCSGFTEIMYKCCYRQQGHQGDRYPLLYSIQPVVMSSILVSQSFLDHINSHRKG